MRHSSRSAANVKSTSAKFKSGLVPPMGILVGEELRAASRS
jgi:hypothetical protein